jgi:hypothetical protein
MKSPFLFMCRYAFHFISKMQNFIFKLRKSEIQKIYTQYLVDSQFYDDVDDVDHYGRVQRRRAIRFSRKELLERYPLTFTFKDWYSNSDLIALEKTHEWFSWSDVCIPYCAWCYYERSILTDDDEHEECDMRLYYCSVDGIQEQYETLADLKPILPTCALDLIASYL